jgi:hypothetical protein
MKLADQIEAMRRSMVEEHQFAMNQLDHLQARLAADHPVLMQKISEITAIQAMQGTEVVQGLMRIASRIGHGPSPSQIQHAQQFQTPPEQHIAPQADVGRNAPLAPPPMPREERNAAREQMNRVIDRADVGAVH